MHDAFCFCGEGGAFHGDVGALCVNVDLFWVDIFCGVEEPLSGDGAEWLAHFDVDGCVLVEGIFSFVGFVDDLVGYDEIAWFDVLSEGSGGAACDDVCDATFF